jgi:3-oxoacyl-[acyl-carrier-protein] synthase-3
VAVLQDLDGTRVVGLGVVHPEASRTTDELIAEMTNPPAFDLVDLTGIKARRWRAPGQNSFTLAVDAARKCLAGTGLDATDLDVIISASITRFRDDGYFQMEPSLSHSITQELGCRPDVIGFDLGNACAGMVTALSVLDNMIRSGTVRRGMVVSGECITPISDTAVRDISEPIDDQFASLTVGDSGVAVILDGSTEPGLGRLRGVDLASVGAHAELCLGLPSAQGPGVAMYTKAVELHTEAIARLPEMIRHYLADWGVADTELTHVIPHQTSSRAIETAMELCGQHFTVPQVCGTLDRYGNTSSTSHFVVLDDHLNGGQIGPGSVVLLIAIASGLVLGAALLTIDGAPPDAPATGEPGAGLADAAVGSANGSTGGEG